jgi:hypothetical protein
MNITIDRLVLTDAQTYLYHEVRLATMADGRARSVCGIRVSAKPIDLRDAPDGDWSPCVDCAVAVGRTSHYTRRAS